MPTGDATAIETLPRSVALPTVQLRHDERDGSWHIDWMIATAPEEGAPRGNRPSLATLRLPAPLQGVSKSRAAVDVRQIADHRAAYLTYEGDISGGRGRVSRIASGELRITAAGNDALEIDSCWRVDSSTTNLRFRLLRRGERRYRIEFAGNSAPAEAQ